MSYASLLFFCIGFAFLGQAQSLDDYQWQNRLIIIYEKADQLSEKGDIQERTLLFNTSQLKERKLRVFRYNGARLKTAFPNKHEQEIKDLGIIFNQDYEMVLIGLDGSIKKRFTSVMGPKWIFDYIDSMPMRQSEIRSKRKN